MLRRMLAILALAAAAVSVSLAIGVEQARIVAERETAADASPVDAAVAVREAKIFFDNPFERLVFVAYAVVDYRLTPDGPACDSIPPFDYEVDRGLEQVVAGYTVFGIELGRVRIECDGSGQRLPPGGSGPSAVAP